MSQSPLNNIDFIQELFDVSWILMDYLRDKRHSLDNPVAKPRKGVPVEALQAVVNLNAMTSQVLSLYNKPDEDYDGFIPETIIDEIELGGS